MSSVQQIMEHLGKELARANRGAHTLDHTLRVHSLAMTISEGMSIDTRVLEAAALLHDIGRPKESETGISHSILSGEMSRDILKECGYLENEIELVVGAIRTHRFSEGIEPTSPEGQVLSDADKLDAMGAIGVYRAIAQAEITGRGPEGFLQHADEKLLILKDMMYTKTAQEIAVSRHNLLSTFVEQLRKESRKAII